MDCKIKSFHGDRAKLFGYKLTFAQKLIRLRSIYLHSEFQYSERYGNISFSATMQDECKGARFKQIEYSHPERWSTVVIPMTNKQEDYSWHLAKKMLGMPYDLKGQLCHLLKVKLWKPSKDKTWCSKAVGNVLWWPYPDFYTLIKKYGLLDEIRPDQLHFMAEYHFKD